MDVFDLRTNPFAVLRVSPRDGRDAIARALERRLGDAEIDEDLLHQAQRSLMAPRPRLQAEATWLIGLAPSRAQTILVALEREEWGAVVSALSVANGLAQANLAAQIASAKPSSSSIDPLIGAYDELDSGEVTEIINAERAVAGFPAVQQSLLEDALENVRSLHLGVALRAVTANEHPGRLMTRLVEDWLEAEGPAHDFLEVLAQRYDNWSAPKLGELEERVDTAIARLRTEASDSAACEDLVHALEAWDEYSQPGQLIFKNKHLDERRSSALYDKLRELVLWLANDRDQYRQALTISKALLNTFPELPSVIDQVPKDIEKLEELAQHAQESALFGELIEIVAEAKACLTLAAEIERGAFGPNGRGVAGRLYTAFAKAAREAVGHEQADLPWLAIRQLTIEMHNEHKETKAALQLIHALLSFQHVEPSPEIESRLREDEHTLRRELLWHGVAERSQQGRWKDALEQLRELERSTADADERHKIVTLRQQLQKRRDGIIGRRFAWGVAAAVVGAIWIGSFDSQPTRPRPSGAPSASTIKTAAPGNDLPPNWGGARTFGLETQPLVGSDRLLNRDQIRYCLFQGERLEAFRSAARTNAQIDHLNRLITDWNSRCSSYRYYDTDMLAVRRELGQQQERLSGEGRELTATGG